MDTSRFDTADSYFIGQQLQSYDPQTRYHLVPGIVGRKIIPPVANVSRNMPSYKYTMVKVLGSTRKSGPRAKDAPTVQVVKEEVIHSIETYEHNATWTIDEVRAAREAGVDLDMDTMLAAQTTIEEDFDATLCSGVAGTTITGIANNASVAATTATDKGGGVTSWLNAATDGDEIVADVRKLISEASALLKQAQVPGSGMRMFDQFVMFLPLGHYQHIDMTRLSSINETVLTFIRKFSALRAVVPWWRLDTAGANGTPRAILAPALDNGAMNPLAGGAILPLDFERLPEQYTGRKVTVPCAGKCGGVAMPYPVAFRYLNGL